MSDDPISIRGGFVPLEETGDGTMQCGRFLYVPPRSRPLQKMDKSKRADKWEVRFFLQSDREPIGDSANQLFLPMFPPTPATLIVLQDKKYFCDRPIVTVK